ncbi:hypothetical protein AVEN_151870-1 [Araneus ventricosus]|uniref:Uncharacterized protein n=1 Tax=Araneus ventricosus TaxID=182803 RepID=A0A4Y2FHF7_ARAVE|nr:hypothetical protein AVEN_98060-1 [Araneus ventricosus]GBM39772.1 hypothetical protein AVEN_41390-1 [Araneus ventricosus]GBM39799.1 hypothetical protein AVEN_151870-1 [Araneus ventricosus]
MQTPSIPGPVGSRKPYGSQRQIKGKKTPLTRRGLMQSSKCVPPLIREAYIPTDLKVKPCKYAKVISAQGVSVAPGETTTPRGAPSRKWVAPRPGATLFCTRMSTAEKQCAQARRSNDGKGVPTRVDRSKQNKAKSS